VNTLKRIFIGLYLAGSVGAIALSAIHLYAGIEVIAFIGVLMTVLPLVAMVSAAFLTQSLARTSANLLPFIVLGAVGIAIVVWQVFGGDAPMRILHVALAGFGGLLLYLFWYSRFGRTTSVEIEVGKTLPKFEVTTLEGNTIASSDLTDKPMILIFIRGNWCPLCTGQVNEMAGAMDKFVDAGIRVAFIAPQSIGKSKALAKGKPSGLEFYSDIKNDAARALKIQNPAGLPFGLEILGYRSDTVLPTVIVLEAGGKIIWTHETDNYRVRPTPDALLAQLSS
jgi:peroxiredoxin